GRTPSPSRRSVTASTSCCAAAKKRQWRKCREPLRQRPSDRRPVPAYRSQLAHHARHRRARGERRALHHCRPASRRRRCRRERRPGRDLASQCRGQVCASRGHAGEGARARLARLRPHPYRCEGRVPLYHHQAGPRSRPRRQVAGAALGGRGLHARTAEASGDAHLLPGRAGEQRGSDPQARAGATARHANRAAPGEGRAAVEHLSPGQERNRFLRLLSLELLFADAQCAAALSDEKLLAAMARFEGALARASARLGLLPAAHAEVISRVCEHAQFDVAALANEGRTGTLAIPFVKALTAEVAQASPEAARHVHAGATSQDVIDTAAVLCLKPACARIAELTTALGNAAAELAKHHVRTPMAARTLLQPALPVTFGWKAAVWLSMLARCLARLREAATEGCILQFGGPSGTLSAFGERGEDVLNALAAELGLPASLVPWHSARDRFARLGAELAILAGAAGKIGRDVSLLMQPEVGEAAEARSPAAAAPPACRTSET